MNKRTNKITESEQLDMVRKDWRSLKSIKNPTKAVVKLAKKMERRSISRQLELESPFLVVAVFIILVVAMSYGAIHFFNLILG